MPSTLNFHGFEGASDGSALDYFTATDAVYPAVGGPVVARPVGRNNHPLVAYSDAGLTYVYFEGLMPKNYDGNMVRLDLFWTSLSGFGDVVWYVAWERDTNPLDSLATDNFAADQAAVSPAPLLPGLVQKATLFFTPAQTSNVAAGDPFRIRVARNGGFGSDTLSGDAQLYRISMEGT